MYIYIYIHAPMYHMHATRTLLKKVLLELCSHAVTHRSIQNMCFNMMIYLVVHVCLPVLD